jgi:protein TonB
MARRLFEQALVLPSGGAGAWPASAVLHAGIAAVLLVVPTLGPLAIPEPRSRPIDTFPSLAAIEPVHAMPAVRPRSAAPRGGHAGPSLRPSAPVPLPAAAPVPTDEPADLPDSEDAGLVDGPQLFGVGDGLGSPDGVGVGLSTGDPGTGPALVRAISLLEQPTKLRHVQPIYPELALHAGVQGVVILECVLDPSGHVADVKVLKGHPLLDEAARTAVRQWVYAPTRLNNVPVAVLLTVTVQFRIPR